MESMSFSRRSSVFELNSLRGTCLLGMAASWRSSRCALLLLVGMLLLAWGATPARAGTTIIDPPVTGPITINAGETVEIHTGGAVTSANTGVVVKTGGELIILDGSV